MRTVQIMVLGFLSMLMACGGGQGSDGKLPGEKESISDIDLEKGKVLYNTCATCHGVNAEGIDSLGAPRLTGLQDWYLQRQIENFKIGVRGAEPSDTLAFQMAPMAKTLTDDQAISNVVGYISTLNNLPYSEQIEGDLSNGKKYYQMVCGTCHGQNAEGNEALNAPNLRDLSVAYLQKQYRDFQTSRRGTHIDDLYGSQMQMMSNSLPEEETITDIFAYIRSLNILEK